MSRRIFDILASGAGLLLFAGPLAVILLLVWYEDRHSPFYSAYRAGIGGAPFRMIKIRSMVVDADKTGVESTGANDDRITAVGHFIRRWKIDELSQLWNVLKGDMSLVGPRPNTMAEVATYSTEEVGLLAVRPGITDISSIVFSDEGDILKDSVDPHAEYLRFIRPWKSQFGLLYARNPSFLLNVRLIWITVIAIIDKPRALAGLQPLLVSLQADLRLQDVAKRERDLRTYCIV